MKNKNNFYKQVTSAVFLVISAVFLGSVSLSALAGDRISLVMVGVPPNLYVWLANKSGSKAEGPWTGNAAINFYRGDNYVYITKTNKNPGSSKDTSSFCRIKIFAKDYKTCPSGSTGFFYPANRQQVVKYACGQGSYSKFIMKIVDSGEKNCGEGAVFKYLPAAPYFTLAIPGLPG